MLNIGYDGADYHGWQVQKNAVTVQEVFQNAVEKVFGARLPVKGCSRTDSGVHANCYFVSFQTELSIACDGVVRALNTPLYTPSIQLQKSNTHAIRRNPNTAEPE